MKSKSLIFLLKPTAARVLGIACVIALATGRCAEGTRAVKLERPDR